MLTTPEGRLACSARRVGGFFKTTDVSRVPRIQPMSATLKRAGPMRIFGGAGLHGILRCPSLRPWREHVAADGLWINQHVFDGDLARFGLTREALTFENGPRRGGIFKRVGCGWPDGRSYFLKTSPCGRRGNANW
jgi:hypothetical protein